MTSRSAPTSGCSSGSSLPLGTDQSSYFGRCTSATSTPRPPGARRQSTPPAASTNVESAISDSGPSSGRSTGKPTTALGPHDVGPYLAELDPRRGRSGLFAREQQAETEAHRPDTRQCGNLGEKLSRDYGVLMLAKYLLHALRLAGELARLRS